jgi:type IV secretory pathway TraG/TraD family ATPase VirD4
MVEGISYSESAMRSGISINKQTLQKDLISSSEIMQLQPLEAYIRLPGELPITKIKLKYKDRISNNEPFIARQITEEKFASTIISTNSQEQLLGEKCDIDIESHL